MNRYENLEKIVKETVSDTVSIFKIRHIPFEYDEALDAFQFEKLIVFTNSKNKRDVYHFVGDIIEKTKCVDTKIYTYEVDGQINGTIELQILE